jgi:hypothetical protein
MKPIQFWESGMISETQVGLKYVPKFSGYTNYNRSHTTWFANSLSLQIWGHINISRSTSWCQKHMEKDMKWQPKSMCGWHEIILSDFVGSWDSAWCAKQLHLKTSNWFAENSQESLMSRWKKTWFSSTLCHPITKTRKRFWSQLLIRCRPHVRSWAFRMWSFPISKMAEEDRTNNIGKKSPPMSTRMRKWWSSNCWWTFNHGSRTTPTTSFLYIR